MKRFMWFPLMLVIAGVWCVRQASANLDRFAEARAEIIRRLWGAEGAPMNVTSLSISARLAELDIDVRKR